MRLPLILLFAALPQLAFAQTCAVDMAAVEHRIAELEQSYAGVLSDISCDAPTIAAHILLCDASEQPNPALWRMGRLDDLAWVYAYENATGVELDHADPPRDESFLAQRDACTDAACLCDLLLQHSNDSLGGTSPYSQ